MTHKQFAELVAEMRTAQKFYKITEERRMLYQAVKFEREVDAALLKMNDKDFEQYVEEVKQEFVAAVNALEWNAEFRTKCETLLIAYDQMKDKLF